MSDDFADFVMSDEEYVKSGLLPVGPPTFGWYKVRAKCYNPVKKVRTAAEAEELRSSGENPKAKPFAIAGVVLEIKGRVIFEPDPDKPNNAIFKEEAYASGSVFADMFWGDTQMTNAIAAFGRQLESSGVTPSGDSGKSPEDVKNALDGGEAYVRIYHKEEKRNGVKTGRVSEAVGSWRQNLPERTYVHPELQEEFRAELVTA